jgi:hypothetical protein
MVEYIVNSYSKKLYNPIYRNASQPYNERTIDGSHFEETITQLRHYIKNHNNTFPRKQISHQEAAGYNIQLLGGWEVYHEMYMAGRMHITCREVYEQEILSLNPITPADLAWK